MAACAERSWAKLARMSVGVSGVGVGFRPELAAGLLRDPRRADFLEVVAESLFARADWLREAHALREIWPIVPHGVKLSLASADGLDDDKARRLGALARELRAPLLSEHVALTRAGARDLGHLTAVPFTKEAVGVVARNVARARRHFPDVPFLLENVAWTFRWPSDAMGEGEFHAAVVEATGCPLLLDVANVYANARNAGVDPRALLETYPLDAVAMIHVAGGFLDHGFWYDTHAHAVPAEVFALLGRAIERCGPAPVVLERDGAFPPFEELGRELDAIRAALDASPARPSADRARPRPSSRGRAAPDGGPEAASPAMVEEQRALAEALVGDAAPPFDPEALARTRAVLREKRLDDALPLLPRLGLRREAIEPLARAGVAAWPRPDALVGPADALRIAEAALAEPALRDDARWDRLVLRARFVGPGPRGEVRPRRAPYVGRERVGARTYWVFKGPGAGAPLRLWIGRGGAT